MGSGTTIANPSTHDLTMGLAMSTTHINETVQYDIAKQKFNKGAAVSGSTVKSGTAVGGTEETIDLGILEKGLYWINFYGTSTNNRFATIDTFNVL